MLATEQASRGWSVHVGLRRRGVHQKQMDHSGLVIHSLGDLRGFHPLLIARVGSLIRKIRPDVLQTWLPQMDLCGGLAALRNSVPWVLSERSVSAAYDRKWPFGWFRPLLAKYAQEIVANSSDGAEYWSRGVRGRVHVSTIGNAINTAAIRKAKPITYLPSDDKRHILLFVGRLLQVKAPEIFLEALMHLRDRRDFHALLIGDGPIRQKLCTKIISDSLEKHVSVLPYQANWWGLLKTATALVSTSRFEGQPNAVLEAMAAGCPLIVSDISAHRSILDDRSALIVPGDDPIALATAIVSLLSDPDAARQKANRAMDRAAGFTIQAAADAYEQVYYRISNGRTV